MDEIVFPRARNGKGGDGRGLGKSLRSRGTWCRYNRTDFWLKQKGEKLGSAYIFQRAARPVLSGVRWKSDIFSASSGLRD